MAKRKKKSLWFGYLEAGERSSPVVRDELLSTGHPATVYLFNYMKGRILEYRKEIVEAKLRELKPEETPMIGDLEAAFLEARAAFTPRALPGPVRGIRAKKAEPAFEFPDPEADGDPKGLGLFPDMPDDFPSIDEEDQEAV